MKEIINIEYMEEKISGGYGQSKEPGNIDFHIHNNYEIYIFLKGQVQYFIEHSCYLIQPGDMLVINSQEIHKAKNLIGESHERFVIHFNPVYIASIPVTDINLLGCFQNRKKGEHNLLRFNQDKTNSITQLAGQLAKAQREKPFGFESICLSCLIQILVIANENFLDSLVEPANQSGYQMPLVMTYLDQHITEELTLDRVADIFSISKYHLSHLFKKETGGSLYRYILLKRVTLAKKLLSEGNTVTDVCIHSGFRDYTNFIRTFRSVTGYSPGKYRKLYQQTLYK